MNRHLEWNDLSLALAIGETGSLSGAARRLGVSHATVFRRLGQMENRLGVALFQRDRTGYTPTVAGEAILATAREVEERILGAERQILGQDLAPSGTVRITTTDTLLYGLLSPVLSGFHGAYPEIRLEVAATNQIYDLSKRETDIALRPSMSPPETLVGRRIGQLTQSIYGHRDLVTSTDSRGTITDLPWIGPDDRLSYPDLHDWMTANKFVEKCRYRVNTVMGQYAAVRDGHGLSVLPRYIGDNDACLVPVGPIIPELTTDLWLLTHPDLRKTVRIRIVMDFIAAAIKRQEARLAGWAS